MTETRLVLACVVCGVHWYPEGESARCIDPGHAHQQFEVHRHRSPVTLPDGTQITAESFDALDPYGRDERPDYGLYLDDRWQPPWPHEHLHWPDFGVPDDREVVAVALRALLDRGRAGERVELGCLGGHGRTGTGLACLAVMTELPAGDATQWVRSTYCAYAIETPEQEAFVADFERDTRAPE